MGNIQHKIQKVIVGSMSIKFMVTEERDIRIDWRL